MPLRSVWAAGLVWLFSVTAAPAQTVDVVTGMEFYNRGQFDLAYRILKSLADSGDSDAQVNLGYLYARGHGTHQDHAEAMRLYRLSADQGNAEGMNAVGFKYLFGSGVGKDVRLAVHWMCRSALSGNPRGLNNLGIMHQKGDAEPRDMVEVRSLWRQAAERGNPSAMFNLGQSLVYGPDEPRDVSTGTKWLVEAGKRGHPHAQQFARRLNYAGEFPPPVNTELLMRPVPRNLPPGKARYCGFYGALDDSVCAWGAAVAELRETRAVFKA